MARPLLILVHEPPAACLARLLAAGFAENHAGEIASYLDQSTDLEPEFPAIGRECAARGLDFRAVALDDAPQALARAAPGETLVWTLTDGTAFFRGAAAPALARLHGLQSFGADEALFALAQDKFRSGAVLAALGLPAPPAGLLRGGEWLAPLPPSNHGWFVKPNRLGAKIGIWPDSHCRTQAEVPALSRRIFAAYRDEAVVQPYVGGRNVRASFLAVEPDAGPERLGVALVESGGDFQTMADSLALYGDTGAAARAAGRAGRPALVPLAHSQPGADRRIREIAGALTTRLGLRDVFSLDFRVEGDGTVHLIEFEVCPGLPCFDFRDYCRVEWRHDLAAAMAQAAAARRRGPQGPGPVS